MYLVFTYSDIADEATNMQKKISQAVMTFIQYNYFM